MYRGFGNMLPSMLIVWIIPIVLLLLMGISVYMIGKSKKTNSKIRSNPVLDILNERFAKGEIDEEEYIKKKRKLSSFK